MIELKRNRLTFRFPDVHEEAWCSIGFRRTLRIPDDNRDYPLPPGLGDFPVCHVDDHLDKVPARWGQHGGVFLPMYQSEAMWISFDGDYPMAVKVAAGKIDALTGEIWLQRRNAAAEAAALRQDLVEDPQNYLVTPEQPWLDGFNVGKGLVRQFVAMPLGEGYSAEEQLTGESQHGGLQIVVYPMKAAVYEAEAMKAVDYCCIPDMSVAPGGLMHQEIYTDPYGLEAWDLTAHSRCFVHILNSMQFFSVTGMEPPSLPPTALDYTNAGMPWFEYYGADGKALAGAMKLAGLDSVAAMKLKQGKGMLENNDPVRPAKVVKLSGDRVREGDF